MTLEPLLSASFAIKLHVATVLPAALVGAYLLSARKGTAIHRYLGRVWISLMVVTSASSFFIHEIDLFHGFSPIHLLSLAVLAGCWQAVRMARQGRIARHRSIVKSLYFGGIGVAGLFTLLPGRIVNAMILGNENHGSFTVALLGALVVLALLTAAVMRRRRAVR